MGETLKPGEVWESPRKKKIDKELARKAFNNLIFEDMMSAADDGEFTREDAFKSLREKPLDGISE